MGDHHAGDVILRHDLPGQAQDLLRGGRVQGSGVLVQQQQLRRDQGGHQQGQGLTLAAGEEAHRVVHPVLQAQAQHGELLPELPPVGSRNVGEGGPAVGGPQVSQGHIFLNGHAGGGAPEGVLKEPANDLAALVVRQEGNVLAVQHNGAGIQPEGSGDGTEEGGFPRTVGAQDGDKVPGIQVEINAPQGYFLVDGADTEGFLNIGQSQHITPLLSSRPAGQAGQWPGPRSRRRSASGIRWADPAAGQWQ